MMPLTRACKKKLTPAREKFFQLFTLIYQWVRSGAMCGFQGVLKLPMKTAAWVVTLGYSRLIGLRACAAAAYRPKGNRMRETGGAPGPTRTGTSLRTTDFESVASTNSATGASRLTGPVGRALHYSYRRFAVNGGELWRSRSTGFWPAGACGSITTPQSP